jgi:hypothetical protein
VSVVRRLSPVFSDWRNCGTITWQLTINHQASSHSSINPSFFFRRRRDWTLSEENDKDGNKIIVDSATTAEGMFHLPPWSSKKVDLCRRERLFFWSIERQLVREF